MMDTFVERGFLIPQHGRSMKTGRDQPRASTAKTSKAPAPTPSTSMGAAFAKLRVN
jgi:hypothetical protein